MFKPVQLCFGEDLGLNEFIASKKSSLVGWFIEIDRHLRKNDWSQVHILQKIEGGISNGDKTYLRQKNGSSNMNWTLLISVWSFSKARRALCHEKKVMEMK